MMKLKAFFPAAVLGLALQAGLQAAPESDPKSAPASASKPDRQSSADGELRVATLADIASTEFATKHDDTTAMVLHHVLEGLVAYDEGLDVRPVLADMYSVSPDGRTYTFRLRKGLRFHNGEPVTAREVVWSWNRFRDPARDWGSHCREWYDGSAEGYHRPVTIESVEALDELTVRFELQSRSAMFLHLVASNHCLSGIVHPDSLGPDGSWRKPVGTGPFELVEHLPAERVTLARFDGYRPRGEARSGFAGAREARVEALVFLPFDDLESAVEALESGEADVLADAPFERARALERSRRLQVHRQQTPAWHQLIVQSRSDPLLSDVRMRRAIAHAIDPAALTRTVLGDWAAPNPSAVPVHSSYYSPHHERGRGFDPERARELLEEAGYDGEPLAIQASREPFPIFYAAAETAAVMLKDVGLNVSVEEVRWEDQDRRYGQNDYQLTSMTFSMRTDPALMYSAVVGQKADHSWYLWEDNEAAALVAYSTVIEHPAERGALFERVHRKMIDWVPTVGLFNYPRYHVTSTAVDGFETWTLGIPRFWGVTVTR